MIARSVFVCANCDHEAPSLAAARRHAREAGPVWSAERGTFVTHKLDRKTDQ